MSAFIGPIHYWLYGKIRLVGRREDYLRERAAALCGSVAEELQEQVRQTYGWPLPDTDLGELIDHDNIHGWLQRQIKIAETREAAFVSELLDTCGDGAADLLEQAFADHGRLTGESAKAQGKHDLTIAPGIYRALGDHYLNGMPCDQADTVIASADDSITWETRVCLQQPNWRRAGANEQAMARLYRAWLAGFVAGANPAFAFRQDGAGEGVRSEIYRK
ncbi:hypothetical protein [Anaeroselena agilis]|uniref:Uncharacterized protein n=1 Tax=Anaeroselena agilis TaxID=3063788 RepID=A0ABU3P0Q1_9FIRM|nr:hypothetical protein [Selenomonadales bacterium 4137-cl]